MVIALLVWVIYAIIAYGYGSALLSWVKHLVTPQPPSRGASKQVLSPLEGVGGERSLFSPPTPPQGGHRFAHHIAHPTLTLLPGFAVISTLATLLSLFIPLGIPTSVGVGIIGIGLLFVTKTNLNAYWQELKSYPLLLWAAMGIVFLFGLINCVIPTQQFDEGLYYTQSIRWLQEYGTVTGLGNLHAKLSFNSSWHTLSALLGLSFSQLNDLNPFLHILVGLFAFSGIAAIYRKEYSLGNVFQAFLIVPTHLFTGTDMNSPAPDFVIMTLVMVIFTLFIQKIERGTLREFDMWAFLIVLTSAFAVTVKLSSAPILILPAYLLFLQIKKQNYASLGVAFSTGLIVVTPWLIRNILLCGYLVYPAHQIDLFSFEWEVPHEIVALEVDETRAFSKIRQFNYAEVREMDLKTWAPYWIQEMRPGEKMVLLFVLASTLFYLLLAFLKRKILFTEKGWGYLVAVATIYLGLAYWFVAAPAMRFGFGFSVTIYLLVAAYIFYQLFSGRFAHFQKWIFAGFCLVILAFYAKGASYAFKNYAKSLQVAEIVFPPTLPGCDCDTETIDGHPVWIPKGTAQCFNSPLPCSPLVMGSLHMRGDHPGKGFVMKGADPAEYEARRIERMKVDRQILLGNDAGDFQYK